MSPQNPKTPNIWIKINIFYLNLNTIKNVIKPIR